MYSSHSIHAGTQALGSFLLTWACRVTATVKARRQSEWLTGSWVFVLEGHLPLHLDFIARASCMTLLTSEEEGKVNRSRCLESWSVLMGHSTDDNHGCTFCSWQDPTLPIVLHFMLPSSSKRYSSFSVVWNANISGGMFMVLSNWTDGLGGKRGWF